MSVPKDDSMSKRRRWVNGIASRLRVRVQMWMIQFEHGVFHLAFGDNNEPDRSALMHFIVAEMRRFIVEEAGAA